MVETVKLGDYQRPFRVVSEGAGGFLGGYMSKEEAEQRCIKANARASALGIKTRYIVVENN